MAIDPRAEMLPAVIPPRTYVKYFSRLSCMLKACSGDPVISACLGKDLVKWVTVEDMLQQLVIQESSL